MADDVDAGGAVIGPIVILAYDGIAADEASVLVDILGAAGLDVIIASVLASPVTSYNGQVVATKAARSIGACSALLVPGGLGVRTTVNNKAVLHAIAQIASSAKWLGATSTGSALLAAAGVIDDARVTTHWLAGDLITDRGLELVDDPYVEWGRLLTAAGIVGTATLSFRIVGALLGQKAEDEVRATFVPPRTSEDRRYHREPRSWARAFIDDLSVRWNPGRSRRRITDESSTLSLMDPHRQAEVIVLDLDLGPSRGGDGFDHN